MLVLHAHWQPPQTPNATGGVLFWAEMSAGTPPTWQRGRIAPNPKPKVHPSCAPIQAVQMLIGKDWDEQSTILRLPTTRSGPLPSPALIHNWELDTATPPALAPWIIHGLWLPLAAAIPLLIHLPERDSGNLSFSLQTRSRHALHPRRAFR